MSTRSLLYHGFGLGTIEITKTTFQGGGTYFHVRRPVERLRCAQCGSEDVCRRGTATRTIRHLP